MAGASDLHEWIEFHKRVGLHRVLIYNDDPGDDATAAIVHGNDFLMSLQDGGFLINLRDGGFEREDDQEEGVIPSCARSVTRRHLVTLRSRCGQAKVLMTELSEVPLTYRPDIKHRAPATRRAAKERLSTRT